MSHQTFKVSIVINDTVENFYIKHYIDDFQPIFQKFKNLVFHRNPAVNVSNLKIYWIDAENDQILISCEEDFRLYIEQGIGKKIYFSVKNVQPNGDDDIAMETEETSDKSKLERRARKSLIREEEKQKRLAKRLAEKVRISDEKVRHAEERLLRNPEKYERKNAEKLERAKKRCDQIRNIIGFIDPANLNPSAGASTSNAGTTTSNAGTSAGASTSTAPPSIEESLAVLHPSAETIRLLSTAIAGCLQPCNLINKILNEIIGMVPTVEPTTSNEKHQQTEVPPQASAATNTSDVNTPLTPANPSSQEIEALFKEAAKELEKMNEIVNNSRSTSLSSSMTGATQIERTFGNVNDSAISNATIVNAEDDVDTSPAHDFKIVTPPKSMRSRESSIEVHDVNSMMSDDSRDWTMLDQEDESVAPVSIAEEINNASAKLIAEEKKESIKTVETQTPSMSQTEVEATLENVGAMNNFIKESLANSMKLGEQVPVLMKEAIDNLQQVPIPTPVPQPEQATISNPAPLFQLPPLPTLRTDQAASVSTSTSAANVSAAGATPKVVQPAVIVYDPNPKINAAVHQMINMGFTNEGGWLTQLLLNVDGDVPKAINFLTPQPKGNDKKRVVLNFD